MFREVERFRVERITDEEREKNEKLMSLLDRRITDEVREELRKLRSSDNTNVFDPDKRI